jgi:uncharacterized protein (DUF2141 family)
MFKSKYWFVFLILIPIILTNCAKRGTITGGPKDTLAPVLTSSFPENYSKKFEGNTIKLNFDEYVKVKDANKQVIVSPPLSKPLTILPQGGVGKTLTIRFTDTLQPNTTYSINFGQSIIDNNEGNPYSAFKYVFTTGESLDSLSIKGATKDALSQKDDDYVSVMLYPAETFTDSTIYNQAPLYITNTLEKNTKFTIDFVKEGKYYLVALKDKANNNKFDPATDKIGFYNEPIEFPVDSSKVFDLRLFQEDLPFAIKRPAQQSTNKVSFGVGKTNYEDLSVTTELNNEAIDTRITRVAQKDSLLLWLPVLDIKKDDSLKITVQNQGEIFTESIRLKTMKQVDSLQINVPRSSSLGYRDNFKISPATPIEKFDKSKISIIKKDSTQIPFDYKLDKLENMVDLIFDKEENEVYTATILPDAIIDFYGKTNDTIISKITIAERREFGDLYITLNNVKSFPLILQLIDKSEKVIYETYSEKETYFEFETIKANDYTVRIIYDTDKNKEWTTGNYLLKRQPEEVLYFQINNGKGVRANWVVNETIDLSQ